MHSIKDELDHFKVKICKKFANYYVKKVGSGSTTLGITGFLKVCDGSFTSIQLHTISKIFPIILLYPNR